MAIRSNLAAERGAARDAKLLRAVIQREVFIAQIAGKRV